LLRLPPKEVDHEKAKLENSSMDSYKPIDELFDITKQNLESWAEGDLELSDQEVIESVKTYLTYHPPTTGLAFLINLSLSYALPNKSRKLIYSIVLKYIENFSTNQVRLALLVICEELDSLVLSVEYLDRSLLFEFVSFIHEILNLNSCTVSTQVVDIWTESIIQADSFSWLTKEINLLLKDRRYSLEDAVKKRSTTVLLIRIVGFFLLISLVFLIANASSASSLSKETVIPPLEVRTRK
jgi:hypothetical protein